MSAIATSRVQPRAQPRVLLRTLELAFWLIGFGLLGWCLYVWMDARLYQSAQMRALERLESAPPASTERKGSGAAARAPSEAAPAEAVPAVPAATIPGLDPLVIGKIDIPRLALSAIVREGVDDETLRRAVGHIPGTALPREGGNVALAGHRDTFFRPLRNIVRGDVIRVKTLTTSYTYKVVGTEIVWPKDTRVLDSDGHAALTLVTCWPFDYVGHAPQRFIVHARRLPETRKEIRKEIRKETRKNSPPRKKARGTARGTPVAGRSARRLS